MMDDKARAGMIADWRAEEEPDRDRLADRIELALREVAEEARREALEQVAERDVALDKAALRVAELGGRVADAEDDYIRIYHEHYAFWHPGASETVRRADSDDFMRRVRALRGEGEK